MVKLNKEEYLKIKERAKQRFKDKEAIAIAILDEIENYLNVPLAQRGY